MEMPAEVYATLAAMVQQFPHTGNDEARRGAMEQAVAQVRARHGLRWVWKTEHQSLSAPSKDGIGYVPYGPIIHGQLTTMYIWDTINGTGRTINAAPLESEPLRLAYVLAVPPRDWLGPPAPPVPPVPPPHTGEIDALRREVSRLRDLVQDAVRYGDRLGLRAQKNGKLLCVDEGDHAIANRDDLGSWEMFQVERP